MTRNREIGERIRRIRKEQKKTQQELADAIGRAKSSVQKYEQGDIEVPRSVLEKIAEVLGTTLESLLSDLPENSNVYTFRLSDGTRSTSLKLPTNESFKKIADTLYSAAYESAVSSMDGFSLFLQQSDIRIEEVTINDQQHYAISLPNTSETCLVTIDQLDLLPDMTAELVAGIVRAWSHKNSEPDGE